MTNSKKSLIINLLTGLLTIPLFVFLFYLAVKAYSFDMLFSICLAVVGIVVNYFIALIFHETGHALFAKAQGLKIMSFDCSLFKVENKKVTFFPFSAEGGRIVLLPTEKTKDVRAALYSSAMGGLIFSAIWLIINVCFLLFSKSIMPLMLFGIGGASSFYLLLVNLLPFDKTSDGCRFFGTHRDYFDAYAAALKLQYKAMQNEGELSDFGGLIKDSPQPIACYFRYLGFLYNGDAEAAFDALLPFKNSLDGLSEDEYGILLPEMIFAASARKDGEFLNLNKVRAESLFERSDDCAVIRAHAAYRAFTGEKEWAETLYKAYLKVKDCAPYQKCEQTACEILSEKFNFSPDAQ